LAFCGGVLGSGDEIFYFLGISAVACLNTSQIRRLQSNPLTFYPARDIASVKYCVDGGKMLAWMAGQIVSFDGE
jgi:hypothetical protein